MKLNSLDLNLLLVFDAILRSGSVTQAADEVGLSQPAMSNALTRLREHFDDPLFVRTRGTMLPTPLAQRFAQPVQDALAQLRHALEDKQNFDARTSQRSFTLCVSEIGQFVVLPRLLGHCREAAPQVVVTTVDMSPEQTQIALDDGAVDLAVGYFADFRPNVFAQRLFQEHYVVMLRMDHPDVGAGLTLDAYLKAPHIAYVPTAAMHARLDKLLDKEFARLGATRRVGLRVAHSLGLAVIVARTDLMLTIPSRMARAFAALIDVRIEPLPLEIPPFDIKQYWHSRVHHDPAIQWLRGQFQTLFQGAD